MISIDDLLGSVLVESLGWTLLHAIWQVALLWTLWAAARACLRRSSAETRYMAGITTLIAMVIVPAGTLMQEFPVDADGIPLVSGPIDIIVGIADGAFPKHGCNWGVAVVTLEITGQRSRPWGKLVLDQRGSIPHPRACRALYLTHKEKQEWTDGLEPYPVTHFFKVTNTDGDGVLEAADELHTWDTAQRDAGKGRRFPDGTYEVTVRAWDLKGNRAGKTASVRVRQK